MFALLRWSVAAVVVLACPAWALAQDKDKELTDNPFYKFWSKSKVGAWVKLVERTKQTAPGGQLAEEDVKLITKKLIALTPEKAVVETVVIEGETFGFVESAPTKHIYPAKMSKEVLQELIEETGAKSEKTKLKVKDKEMDVTLISGGRKGKDEEIEHKIWISDVVPGGIVKEVRTIKVKGEVVAETTTDLHDFGQG
jgi:hypothetical protein